MKPLVSCIAVFFVFGGAFAQKSLPSCQGGEPTRWNNCSTSITYDNGDKYVGEFKDGNRNGQGTYIFQDGKKFNGDKYVGEFKDGKFHGRGTYYYLSENQSKGNKYVGEFRDGEYNGQGTLTLAYGDKYVGNFKDQKYEGLGTLYSLNGEVILQGIWSGGKFLIASQVNLPQCKFQPADLGDCFANINYSSGNRYVGLYRNGKTNGAGAYFSSSGSKYIGEWKDGKSSGLGTLYDQNGTINAQGLFADGEFVRSAPLLQVAAPNSEIEKLRIEAEEAKKKQAQLENQLKLFQNKVANETTSQPASAPLLDKRIALVIGNANYKIRPLRNPRNDAEDVSNALKAAGFQVIDLRDATIQQMRVGVRQFGDRLLSNDVGLVYYSGHGVEVKGRNYFIPVNAEIMREDEIADQGLDVSLILEKMSTAGKGVNILIVDACRDDPFGRSFRSSSRGLAQMDAPRGTIIAYATSPGKVAADGEGRNSPYTKNLVKVMQQPNKPIEQVFKEVRRAVQEETKNQQTPWENTSLSGEFFFKLR